MWNRIAVLLVALPALATVESSAQAPAGGEDVLVYEREVFDYSRRGRPDPFRSLLNQTELGVRIEDLALRGIVYHPDPARSLAVFSRTGSERPVRVRVGDRIGTVRIVAIGPRSVDVVAEELGIARRARLELKRSVRPKEEEP